MYTSFENLFFAFGKTRKCLFWRSVVGQLCFLSHETKTYRNGSADLVATIFGMQLKDTISLKALSAKAEEDLKREA